MPPTTIVSGRLTTSGSRGHVLADEVTQRFLINPVIEAADVSFPGFVATLHGLGARIEAR